MLNLLLMSDGMTGLVGFFIGMVIVFLGIAILVAVVWLVGKIIALVTEKKDKTKTQPVTASSSASAVSEQSADDGEIPEHIKVAITAAVYAYYAEANDKCEFTVRKIVRR